MTFVNAGLLIGAVFVAVPIVLHLVMRRQPKHLEFPAIRFLQSRRDANRRRLKLRHLLLLLLRTAAICLLAAALARPSLRGSGVLGSQEAPVAAAVVIDTSPRMEYRRRNRTRLEAAREMAEWLLTQLPPSSEVAVIDTGGGDAAFAIDLGAAKQRIERLRVTPAARGVPYTVETALALLDEKKLRREIYVLTDLTHAAWDASDASSLGQRLAEKDDVGIYVIDVGVTDPQNFALGPLRLSGQTLARQSPLTITTELKRTGPEARRSVELYLVDEDGASTKRGQQTESWADGQSRAIEFRLGGMETGTHQGFLRVVGEDALKWDDVRYFTVDVRLAWPVLIAASSPENAVYAAEALSPEAFRESGQSRFECRTVNLAELNEQPLADFAAVLLLDPRPLAEETWQRLAEYATSGGAVAIFLGHHAQPLNAMNAEAPQWLLAGPLKRQWRSTTYLAPESLNHPLLAKFRPLEGSVPWSAFPVFRYWQIDELADGVTEIMPYATGHPALLEKPLGKGRVLTMTTPVSDPANLAGRETWNVLPTGIDPWPFVMLINELALYLVGNQEEQLNYQAGETAVLRTEAGRQPSLVLVTSPGGQQIRKSVDTRNRAIVITSTDQPGNYRVRAGGEIGGLDRGFSVNIDPAISRLERIEPARLDEVLGEGRYRLARDRREVVRDQGRGRVGRELFPLLIALVALALGAEQVLANRFYRRAP